MGSRVVVHGSRWSVACEIFFYFWLWWVFVAVRRPSVIGASGGCSLVAVQASHYSGLFRCRAQALGHAGFSSCGLQRFLPFDMWSLLGPGIRPMSPALAGRF